MLLIVTVHPLKAIPHGLTSRSKNFIVLEAVSLVCLGSTCETPILTQMHDAIHQLPTTKTLLLYLHI